MSFSEKVQGRHQDRLALVYVRQSTIRQVEQNQEPTRLQQYALVERALQLGWARQRVEVIDDDLGRSGTTTANRPGFQPLMTEVGLGHVGLVLGVGQRSRQCAWAKLSGLGIGPPLTDGRTGMRCIGCGSEALTERSERTVQGYRRFRCRLCGKQFNERTGTMLNRTHYPSDVVALVVI